MTTPSGSHSGQEGLAGSAKRAQSDDPRLGHTITWGTTWSGISRLGMLSFGLVGQALTARLLAPADFGFYNLILSVTGSMALIGQVGLPQSTVRAIARANAIPGGSQARPVISASAILALVAAVAAGVFVFWPLGRLVGQFFPDGGLEAVLGLFAVLVGIQILENITPELFRGVRDFRSCSIFGGLLSTVLLAALTAVVLVTIRTASLGTALVISITASAISLVAAVTLLWRKLRSLPSAPRPRLLGLGVLSPAIWIASVISYSISQLDLWVVGALGTSRDVALYSAAFRLSALVTAPLNIVSFVVPPLVVELLARDQSTRLRQAIQTMATVAGAPAFVALVMFAAFGSWICGLAYGGFYVDAGTPLALLAIGKLANVLAGPCGITLMMSGGQRTNLRILALNIALTLPMQVLGLRLAGLAGLAITTSIGFALLNVHQSIAVRRRIGVGTEFNIPQTCRLLRNLAERGLLRQLLTPKWSGKHRQGA